jgi:hypothetical protein
MEADLKFALIVTGVVFSILIGFGLTAIGA